MLHVIEHADGTLSDGQMTPGLEPIGPDYHAAAAAMGGVVVALPGLEIPSDLHLKRIAADRKNIEPHEAAIAAFAKRQELQAAIGYKSRELAIAALLEVATGSDRDLLTAELVKAREHTGRVG
jgi:hypothetical protein